ncbi:MAG: phosphonopyruvate decarboxylase [Cyanobacteria bacterium REEB67]|nr:phosphonopyruvate decarboxylase [Cyanobacteria bacterium REEB67]
MTDLQSAGVDFYTGVPDSLLKEFLTHLQVSVSADKHHITASEGAAVALAAGYHLATGKVPLVYMQNSGLGNAVNPLMSLTHHKVYGLPVLLMIGHRGQPGVQDEPQHVAMGAATLDMLKAMSIPFIVISGDEEDLSTLIKGAVQSSLESNAPVALVVAAASFDKASSPIAPPAPTHGLRRDDVILALLAKLPGNEAVVASTGFNGRVLYEARQTLGQGFASDFLNVGAMGHALPIAVGIALGQPDREVICIDGDGALLMHLGSLLSAGKSGARVRHLLINNNAHESVGGQPTGTSELGFSNMALLAGYQYSHKMQAGESLENVLQAFLQGAMPAFLEVPVDLGVKDNLARPSADFKASKISFMDFLKG